MTEYGKGFAGGRAYTLHYFGEEGQPGKNIAVMYALCGQRLTSFHPRSHSVCRSCMQRRAATEAEERQP